MDAPHEPTRRNWTSFWSLMGLQTQNAFNDKAVQFLLVPLGVWLTKEAASSIDVPESARGPGLAGSIEYLLAGLIVTPFVLFAPVAGWVSDRFSKQHVIQFFAWFQMVVLGLILTAVWMKFFPLAVGGFFLLAVQSTFLSPAKLGIIKELLGSKRLGFASGMMEMFTILAILGGTILMGFWFDGRLAKSGSGWQAGLVPVVVLTVAAVTAIVAAHLIERTPRQSSKEWHWSIALQHFHQMAEVMRERPLRLSALGVAYFWGFGGVVQLISVQISRDLYGGAGSGFATALAWMMLAAGGGIAAGSVVASLISKRHIELGLIPLGGIIMTLATGCLAFAEAQTVFFFTSLAGAGFGSAFFLVPVNAFLQDTCKPERRGSVLAGSNLLNCLFGLLAVLGQLGMKSLGLSPKAQFLLMAITVVGATIYVVRLLPRQFLRLVLLSAVRTVYRIKVYHADRMPEEGGVLLLPNHVSYIDALILSAASPRHVRFLMLTDFFDRPLVGRVARLFDTVPISRTRAKDAIRAAAEAVEEGGVVCVFPEGTLSRDGMLGELKKGYELIARRAGCPAMAVYMDGLWGSIFSAERGRFFWKIPRRIPYGVRVAFGEPRPPDAAGRATVRSDLKLLAGEMIAKREEVAGTVAGILRQAKASATAATWWADNEAKSCSWGQVAEVVAGKRTVEEVAGEAAAARRWLEGWLALDGRGEDELRELTENALQVAEPIDIGDGAPGILLGADAPDAAREVWGMVLPVFAGGQVVLADEDATPEDFAKILDRVEVRDAVGGPELVSCLDEAGSAARGVRVFRFNGEGQIPREAARRRYACRTEGGRVISISLPHAPALRDRDEVQRGWKEGSHGRLLVGFAAREINGGLELHAPGGREVAVLEGWRCDEDGFLFGE